MRRRLLLVPTVTALLGTLALVAPTAQAAPGSERLAGANRYETAAKVSAARFPTAGTVLVATGENFPDALAGGAVGAALGAPLLLVTRSSVPAETSGDLRRLSPAKVVVLGGAGVIDDAVLGQLRSILPGANVSRAAGADRYATAVVVGRLVADSSSGSAVVANGASFVDALAGGPLAAAVDGPLLLASSDGLPQATLDELRRRNVHRVYVPSTAGAGDPASQALRAAGITVLDLAGADATEMSVAVSRSWSSATNAYLATSRSFADGLAAGAAAGRDDAPLLLVSGTCATGSLVAEVARLAATKLTVLGGTAAVPAAIESLNACSSSTTSTTVKPSSPTTTAPSLANPGDTKNCNSFSSYADAKAWFDTYFPLYGDVARLDSDGDGIPCENLPGAPG
jgi:putative cell wall-binding protein